MPTSFRPLLLVLVVGIVGCPSCNTPREQGCNNDAQCEASQVCSAGSCVERNPGGSSGGQVGSSRSTVSSSGTGSTSAPPSSRANSSSSGASSGTTACDMGLLLCGTACIDPLTDSEHCGATGDCLGNRAGEQCPGTKSCTLGHCGLTCQSPLVACTEPVTSMEVCIDPRTSPQFCGASLDCTGTHAGARCRTDQVCRDVLGCTCAAGQKECNGRCIPDTACCTTTDCNGAGSCVSVDGGPGSCVCPVGEKLCDGVCIPETSCCADGECPNGQQCLPVPSDAGVVKACGCGAGQSLCGGTCQVGTGCCNAALDCALGQVCITPDAGATRVCVCDTGAVFCARFNQCIPDGTCCGNGMCGQNQACALEGGIPGCVCDPGFHNCNGACIPDGTCCDAPNDCMSPLVCPSAGGTCGCPAGTISCGDFCAPNCGVNGACGAPNDTCTRGTPTSTNAIACGTTHTWNCVGSSGGTTAPCSLPQPPCPVNGACNNATPDGCTTGTASQSNLATACGTTRTWHCDGANGGASTTNCSLANAACGCPGTTVDLGCGCGNPAPNSCGSCNGSVVNLGCGCGNPAPNACASCNPAVVDVGCGCGNPAPNACASCNPAVVDVGCGCGNPAPNSCGSCNGSVVDLGCGCGNPAPNACGLCGMPCPTICPAAWSTVTVDPYGSGCVPAADGCNFEPYVMSCPPGGCAAAWVGHCGTMQWEFGCDETGWWVSQC